jgi:aryl-alcohol dehydrogenase-like predicted oxidoreductase
MRYRTLGRTGLEVSVIAFGAGPVSGLMTGNQEQLQLAVLSRALDAGINWIDTAAGYGNGASERNLGRCLHALGPRQTIHVATKVRLARDDAGHPSEAIRRSVHASLERLQLPKVTLLQLHNAITPQRGAQAASVSPVDVLSPGGIADALESVRSAGLTDFIGLTGTGEPGALREVIRSGRFDTIQAPYHLLNPSAARAVPPGFHDVDYGRIFLDCAQRQMGIFAIRVFAGGALLGNSPSAHTLTTPYFPLSLFERDSQLARDLALRFHLLDSMPHIAIRYVLSHPLTSSAIVGFGTPAEVEAACAAGELGELPESLRSELEHAAFE